MRGAAAHRQVVGAGASTAEREHPTPCARRSRITPRISSSVLAQADHHPVLVGTRGTRAFETSSAGSCFEAGSPGRAPPAQARHGSRLWFIMSGGAACRSASDRRGRGKSGVRDLDLRARRARRNGGFPRRAAAVAQVVVRSTLVMTYGASAPAMVSASLTGLSASSGSGRLAVAERAAAGALVAHDHERGSAPAETLPPMLGQLSFQYTVCSFCSRRIR